CSSLLYTQVPCHLFTTAPATPALSPLSLHDALPILTSPAADDIHQHFPNMSNVPSDLRYAKSHEWVKPAADGTALIGITDYAQRDRKSTRLNSSHVKISYAVFCLKKKNLADINLKTQLPQQERTFACSRHHQVKILRK